MHHAFGNRLVGQLVRFLIRKFSTDHAIYILDCVWLAVVGEKMKMCACGNPRF
jgi:hypothetical protein